MNHLFQTKYSLLLLILLSLIACNQSVDYGPNDRFTITDYQGKWVIINYWAEWCAPCIKEIPELNALDANYSDQLEVFAVNFDKIMGDELKALSARMGISFDLIEKDPADILRLSRPASLPTTYIFDQNGILQFKLVGPQTSESLLKIMSIAGPPLS